MKRCPFCAEEIPDDATMCPLCNSDLGPALNPGQPVQPKTCVKAIASLVSGLFFFLLPAAVLAVVLGHLSRSDIRKNPGRLKGKGLALLGLIFGYFGVALVPLLIAAIYIPGHLTSRMPANEASAIASLRAINVAAYSYVSTYEQQGYPPDLVSLGPPGAGQAPSPHAAGLIDEVVASGTKSGYRLTYTPGKQDSDGRIASYTVHANPITPGTTGKNFYYTDETMVIRQEVDKPATAESAPLN